jgi:hypothetical protein
MLQFLVNRTKCIISEGGREGGKECGNVNSTYMSLKQHHVLCHIEGTKCSDSVDNKTFMFRVCRRQLKQFSKWAENPPFTLFYGDINEVLTWEKNEKCVTLMDKYKSTAETGWIIFPGKGRTVKGKIVHVLNWAPRHEGVVGEWRYSSIHSLTSALDGGEWSASRPDSFTPKERALVSIE